MTAGQSSQSIVANAPTEHLRDTLRLASDLAEALAAQSDRARRQADALSTSPLASTEIDRLINQASRVRRQCAELMRELDTIDSGSAYVSEPEPYEQRDEGQGGAGVLAARKRFRRRRVDDAAIQTLALELKMGGLSREDVARTLEETFGVAGAAEIVDGVFDGAAA
jgi:hypothetical protein